MNGESGTEIAGTETVCAVLTPRGEGGISIMQVRGPDAFGVVDGIFQGKRPSSLASAEVGRLYLGRLVDGDETLDEVMVARRSAPEPLVEIQCHAGHQSVRRIADCLAKFGIREIDDTAYLARQTASGELDLIQQEALTAILHARSGLALSLLLSQYHGSLTRFVRDTIVGRASLDDLRRLLKPPRLGEILCSPPRVVLVGPTNAGKSSLFNALLKQDRVITSPVPGTTRDAIEEEIVIEGLPLTLVDTAGLRQTEHPIETLAIQVSEREIAGAHLAVFLFDGSVGFPDEVLGDYRRVAARVPNVLPVVNKIDIDRAFSPELLKGHIGGSPLGISALKGTGLKDLCLRLLDAIVPERNYTPGEPAVFTSRQASLLSRLLDVLSTGRPQDSEALAVCRQLLGRPTFP
jgi:tRNA modification GTPase